MIITCPGCGKRFGVRDELVPRGGRRARCAGCGEMFIAQPVAPGAANVTAEGVHFNRIDLPGDGLASGSSFAAPAAPMSIVSQGTAGRDGPPRGSGGQPPVIVSPAASTDPGGREPAEVQPAPDATVAIDPEEAARLRASAVAAAHRAGVSLWRLRRREGGESLHDKADLVGMIRAGTLRPEDLLAREASENWAPAGELPELRFYFRLRSAGGDATGEAEPGGRALPVLRGGFPRELAGSLVWPLKGWGPTLTIGAAAAVAAAVHAGPAAGLLLLALTPGLGAVIVRGSKGPPKPLAALRCTVASAVALAPVVLLSLLAVGSGAPGAAGGLLAGGRLVLLGLTFLYLPMSFLLAATSRRGLAGLDPVSVVGAVLGRPARYGGLLLFLLATGAGAAGAMRLLSAAGVPEVWPGASSAGTFVLALPLAYASLASLRAMGRFGRDLAASG